jgi:hypothetical protein
MFTADASTHPPAQAQNGEPGEERELHLELEIITSSARARAERGQVAGEAEMR